MKRSKSETKEKKGRGEEREKLLSWDSVDFDGINSSDGIRSMTLHGVCQG